MVHPGGAVSGSWKQSSGNHSWLAPGSPHPLIWKFVELESLDAFFLPPEKEMCLCSILVGDACFTVMYAIFLQECLSLIPLPGCYVDVQPQSSLPGTCWKPWDNQHQGNPYNALCGVQPDVIVNAFLLAWWRPGRWRVVRNGSLVRYNVYFLIEYIACEFPFLIGATGEWLPKTIYRHHHGKMKLHIWPLPSSNRNSSKDQPCRFIWFLR